MPERQAETSVVERDVRIEAEPETVFPFFTDPEKLVRWLGLRATLDPRPGGVFRVNSVDDHFIEGEYLEVEPPSRVVFTWGYLKAPAGLDNPLPPGSSTVEVELIPDGAATVVCLTHRAPVGLADFHAMGWENYLPRLAIVVGGGDPGPDPFVDYVRSLFQPHD